MNSRGGWVTAPHLSRPSWLGGIAGLPCPRSILGAGARFLSRKRQPGADCSPHETQTGGGFPPGQGGAPLTSQSARLPPSSSACALSRPQGCHSELVLLFDPRAKDCGLASSRAGAARCGPCEGALLFDLDFSWGGGVVRSSCILQNWIAWHRLRKSVSQEDLDCCLRKSRLRGIWGVVTSNSSKSPSGQSGRSASPKARPPTTVVCEPPTSRKGS